MPVRYFFAAEFFPAASFEIVLLVDDNSLGKSRALLGREVSQEKSQGIYLSSDGWTILTSESTMHKAHIG